MSGTLYVVATPIGNLEDITARALRILNTVDLIAAEDTRHSRKLMTHFGIKTPLTAYHDHNERQKATSLVAKIAAGQAVALISDAGTPAIADPGFRLVRACRDAGLTVVPVPGASAILSALSVAGLPTDRFTFEGFLPSKATARKQVLLQSSHEPRTLVFYESPHRLHKSLADMADVWPDREIAVGRELTKKHEQWASGTSSEVAQQFAEEKVRGEIVIVVAPAEKTENNETVEAALRRWRNASDLSWKQIVKQVASEKGVTGSDVYEIHLRVKKEMEGERE